MSKQLLAIVLIVFFCASPSISQKQKQTTSQKRTASPFADRLVPPAIPIEVQLTYYKLKTPSVILTIKNNDPKRRVNSVICSIQAFDSIRLTVSKDFKTMIFSFAIPVGPRETGKAILETSEEGFYPGRCIEFQPKKESPTVFLPRKCTQDAFTVSITAVIFSDNTGWPKATKESIKEAKEKEPFLKSTEIKSIAIKSQDYPKTWPFNVAEGSLGIHCETGAIFFTTGATTFGLNGWAYNRYIDGKPVSIELGQIQSPALSEEEFSKSRLLLVEKAQTLCSPFRR